MIRFDMTCNCFSGVGSLQKKACKACTREGRDVDMTVRFKWSHSRFEEIQRNQSAGQKPVTIFDNGGLCESKGLGFHVTTSIPFRMPLRKNLAVGVKRIKRDVLHRDQLGYVTLQSWCVLQSWRVRELSEHIGTLKFATCKLYEFWRFCNTM